MKPPPFEYRAASSVDEVIALLTEHGDEAKIIAGGQSLMPLLSLRLARPGVLVDVNRVPGLSGISQQNGHLVFGATTRERDAERSPLVTSLTPVLAEALPFIGHTAIRNRGTIGGSIAHADAAAELPAVAVITDASVVVRGPGGERTIAADDFFVGHYSTTLADDEFLLSVQVPAAVPGAGWAFREVARRPGDFALVAAAAMVSLGADGTITEARICVSGVGDRPIRPRSVEAALVGASPSSASFLAAATDTAAPLEPSSDVHGSSEVRRHLTRVMVEQALTAAAQRAGAAS